MDFILEINNALQLGFEGFKHAIYRIIKDNPDFLKRSFVSKSGTMTTALNYLITLHLSTPSRDLTKHIAFLFSEAPDINFGEPIHQAITSGKLALAFFLLQMVDKYPNYQFEQRDVFGQTLLSLILKTQNTELLTYVLQKKLNVNSSFFNERKIMVQPLHEAVRLDYRDGVMLLTQKKAQLANTVGARRETPVLMAARELKLNALEALLEHNAQELKLEAKNTLSLNNIKVHYTAVETLCTSLKTSERLNEVVKGIAMLLCCGAEPPRDVNLRTLLSDNRELLLKNIDSYLKCRPKLVEDFVRRCHIKESPLHHIIYANHSWGSAIRRLFGRPSDAAFIVENWVSRTHCPDNLLKEELSKSHSLRLHAEFVRRYKSAYDDQVFTNSWSEMRWMIANGQSSWSRIKQYAESNPSTRSGIIVKEMIAQITEDESQSALASTKTL